MDNLKSLGIASFTVVGNDPDRKSSLTKTLAQLVVAAGLTVGAVGMAQSSESLTEVDRYQQRVDRLVRAPDNSSALSRVTDSALHIINEDHQSGGTDKAKQSSFAKEKANRTTKSATVAIEVAKLALIPELTATAWAAKVVTGTTVSMATDDVSHGKHVAAAVSGAAMASTMGPVGLGVYALSQTYASYNHIKDTRLREDVLDEARMDLYEAKHEERVLQINIERYKDERAAWADMPDDERAAKHALYTEAATAYLLNPSDAYWIEAVLELERTVGAENQEYMPWYAEGVARAAEIHAARDLEEARQLEQANSNAAVMQPASVSGVNSLNSLVQALDTTAPGLKAEREPSSAPGMR